LPSIGITAVLKELFNAFWGQTTISCLKMSLFCNFFQMVRNIILPSFWSTTPTTKNFRRQTHLGLPHQDGIIYNQSVSVPPTMTYIAIGTMLGVV